MELPDQVSDGNARTVGCDEHERVRRGEQPFDPGAAVVSWLSSVPETITGGAVLGEKRGAQGDQARHVSSACAADVDVHGSLSQLRIVPV